MTPRCRTPSVRHWALLLAAAALVVAAAGARQAEQLQVLSEASSSEHQDAPATTTSISPNQQALLTYFMDITKPEVQLLPAPAHGPARPGRTPLRVKVSGAAAVSAFMPVISPRPTGMTHQVVKTWSALKNYALMFARVDAINKQATGDSPRLFPLPGIAVTAAADTPAATTDIGAFIDAAEAHGQHDAWTETSPGSVLLMPAGQSVAAVADIMHIAYDEAADAITLDLDLVHDPDTVSEFDHHGKQTLDAKTSHYHLATPAGVKVDAAGLLKVLRESDYKLAGLHAFVKGLASNCQYYVKRWTVSQDGTTVTYTVELGDNGNCGGCIESKEDPARCPQRAADGKRIVDGGNGVDPCTDVTLQYTGTFGSGSSSGCLTRQAERQTCGLSPNTCTGQTNNSIVTWTFVGVLTNMTAAILNISGFLNFIGGGFLTSGPLAKLVISPAKVYRHVHDRVTVTVVALGAGNTPMAGATVTFAVSGDCGPLLAATTVTTDAAGRAVAYVSAQKPGAVAVVAAATSASGGARLVTPPAHIIFGEPEYVHHREREYYGGRHEEHYRDAETYGMTEPEAGSDAERFAAEAAKKALAQLPA